MKIGDKVRVRDNNGNWRPAQLMQHVPYRAGRHVPSDGWYIRWLDVPYRTPDGVMPSQGGWVMATSIAEDCPQHSNELATA